MQERLFPGTHPHTRRASLGAHGHICDLRSRTHRLQRRATTLPCAAPNLTAFTSPALGCLQDGTGIRALLAQVGLDQFVHHPLMYFPVFYMIKDFVTSDSPDPSRAVGSYIGNMQEDLIALWKIWVPSTLVNFAIMPMWGRIPWVASTSLIWTCILSAMRGGSDAVPEKNVFSGVDAQTFELVTRGAIGPAPRLDPKRSHLLVTINGLDRKD